MAAAFSNLLAKLHFYSILFTMIRLRLLHPEWNSKVSHICQSVLNLVIGETTWLPYSYGETYLEMDYQNLKHEILMNTRSEHTAILSVINIVNLSLGRGSEIASSATYVLGIHAKWYQVVTQ